MDYFGVSKGEVNVVAFADRTFTKARLAENQELLERASGECVLREKRYSPGAGIWRTQEEPETDQTDMEDRYPRRCFSADQRRVVYSKDGWVRIYDTVTKTLSNLEFGHGASWSPDGKLIGFSDGKNYILLDWKTGSRTKLFSTKDTTTAEWSPDSRYLTYTKAGGSPGEGSLVAF